MDMKYWLKQTTDKPLFPDIEWSKPEQRNQRGKLGIIGGSKLGFMSTAEAYSTALNTGAGEVKALLPDALKRSIPKVMTDIVYSKSNPNGGLGKDSIPDLEALEDWASGLLFIGDAGKNSETALAYTHIVKASKKPITITRDAFDLLKLEPNLLVEKPNICLVISFAQLQKLFQAVYYPKVLTFSMQLMQLVQALHKFTVTYPVTIATFHQETLVVAHDNQVTTTPWTDPMRIWRGDTATKAACYLLWTPSKPLQAVTTSLLK